MSTAHQFTTAHNSEPLPRLRYQYPSIPESSLPAEAPRQVKTVYTLWCLASKVCLWDSVMLGNVVVYRSFPLLGSIPIIWIYPLLLIHSAADGWTFAAYPVWGHHNKVSVSISAYVFEYPCKLAKENKFHRLPMPAKPDFSLLDCTARVTLDTRFI